MTSQKEQTGIGGSPWFLQMIATVPKLRKKAAEEGWILVIPTTSEETRTRDPPTSESVRAHILVPSKLYKSTFETLLGETHVVVIQKQKCPIKKNGGCRTHIVTRKGFREIGRSVRVLREEYFYNSDFKPFRVFAVDRPLVQSEDVPEEEEEVPTKRKECDIVKPRNEHEMFTDRAWSEWVARELVGNDKDAKTNARSSLIYRPMTIFLDDFRHRYVLVTETAFGRKHALDKIGRIVRETALTLEKELVLRARERSKDEITKSGERTLSAVGAFVRRHINDISAEPTKHDAKDSASLIVARALRRSLRWGLTAYVFERLYGCIFGALRRRFLTEERSLRSRLDAIRLRGGLKPAEVGLQARFHSVNLDRAVREMQTLNRSDRTSPLSKLQCILSVGRIISAELNGMMRRRNVHRRFDASKDESASIPGDERPTVISSDDILPLFVVVVARAAPQSLNANAEYMSLWSDNASQIDTDDDNEGDKAMVLSRSGEGAFCLANFTAAVAYLRGAGEDSSDETVSTKDVHESDRIDCYAMMTAFERRDSVGSDTESVAASSPTKPARPYPPGGRLSADNDDDDPLAYVRSRSEVLMQTPSTGILRRRRRPSPRRRVVYDGTRSEEK